MINRCSSTESWIPLILSSTFVGTSTLLVQCKWEDDKGQVYNSSPQPAPFVLLFFLPSSLPIPSPLFPQGETLSSTTTVGQLGVSPGQSVELQVQEATPITLEGENPANFHRSTATVTHSAHHMPDVFTVQVQISINQSINQICSRGRFPTNYELITFVCRWQWGRRRRKFS